MKKEITYILNLGNGYVFHIPRKLNKDHFYDRVEFEDEKTYETYKLQNIDENTEIKYVDNRPYVFATYETNLDIEPKQFTIEIANYGE